MARSVSDQWILLALASGPTVPPSITRVAVHKVLSRYASASIQAWATASAFRTVRFGSAASLSA